jgi:hypothetical protein
MMTDVLRRRLAAFAMTVMIGGPLLALAGLFVAMGADSSGRAVGDALARVIEVIVICVTSGGILRTLVSIDARLENRG